MVLASAETGRARARTFRLWAVVAVAATAAMILGSYWDQHRHGDPDPGHHRVNAIRPVLTVVPGGAVIEMRDVVNPRWDSCDGKNAGWNDAMVDVQFTSAQPPAAIVAHIANSLSALGWTLAPGQTASGNGGAWNWSKTIEGARGTVQLLGGPGSDPQDWDLQASVPPATHALPCI